MGPSNDTDAVVNPQLQVYGIKNLRVVDASISMKIDFYFTSRSMRNVIYTILYWKFSVPDIPAAHTNAVVFMIGEKAADMVKDTWS